MYLHQQWQVRDGLPQNTVNCLMQTRDGFIWMGTHEGLVRFDGKRFLSINSKSVPILKSNRISALCEDKNDAIWIATFGAGIYKLYNGVLTRVPLEKGFEKQKIVSGQFFTDKNGFIWGISHEGYLLINKDSVFNVYPNAQHPLTGFYLVPDNNYGMVLQRGAKVYSLALSHSGKFSDLNVITIHPFNKQQQFLKIAPSFSGNAYLIYRDMATELNSGKKIPFTYTAKHGNAFYIDSRDNIWYRVPNLYRYEQGRLDSLQDISGFTNKLILSILEGREGEIWIGTDNTGLHKLSDTKFTTFTKQNGLQGDIIWNVCEDINGSIWASSLQGYVAKIDNLQIKNIFISNDVRRKGFAGIYPGRDGTVFTTYYYLYGILHEKTRRLFGKYNDKIRDFQSMFQDREGKLWVGTERQGVFYEKNGELVNITFKDGLSSNYISCITQDHSGTIWIGTQSGLYKISNGKQVGRYTESEGLPNNWVRTIHVDDDDGSLWLGTENGLSHFYNGKFINYTTADGLFNNV
ncbi:MAG: hypothetical protein HYV28_17885, partial [Ignavibacteriales bacterium]|nr:hypothetical protein [Ignavibacteriales bacterium]